MKKIIVVALATVLISGTVMAQQSVEAGPKSEKAAKHARKKKKHHRENGTADADRQASPVSSKSITKPADPAKMPRPAAPAY